MSSTSATSPPLSMHQNIVILLIGMVAAIFHVFFQAAIFDTGFRPDEGDALLKFINTLAGGAPTRAAEYWSRISLTFICVAISLLLYQARMITAWTLAIAAAWPMTWFLFSKLYWEWFVFPICLIRYDISKSNELLLILVLIFLLVATGEQNLVLIIAFRGILYFQKLGYRKGAPLSVLAFGLITDALIESGLARNIPVLGPTVQRFDWTRDIVNPEYSIFETFAVFLSSFHFFTLHTYYWFIDIIFSAACVALFLIFPGGIERLRSAKFEILAFFCLLVGVSSITHGFQNARYFFLYIPLIAMISTPGSYALLVLIGIFHVLFKSVEGFYF